MIMRMRIFDDIAREGVDPPHQDEAALAYLNRSNRVEAPRFASLSRQHPRNGNALTLPAGELVRKERLLLGPQAQTLEDLVDP